jgi:hypothetical protein
VPNRRRGGLAQGQGKGARNLLRVAKVGRLKPPHLAFLF